MSKPVSQLTLLEVTDPQWISRHRRQDERHRRNLQWLQAHWSDLPEPRGRYVAVADERMFGIGGAAACVIVEIAIELTRDDGGPAVVRGKFTAFTDTAASDMSVMGRDVLNNFDVVVSRPRSEVLLLAPRHGYRIVQANPS
jgi:hypothetical protein